ncbi:hypothetical protein BB561_001899 [Smittium simulii]|uniref:Uncharacterized protein n=1 Tax=Smittium simulii TaxID=133385 RepID=A0A2T9YSM8_9FUNG|nr:hypothetical protein BB561_001899 [Smittium simulii]
MSLQKNHPFSFSNSDQPYPNQTNRQYTRSRTNPLFNDALPKTKISDFSTPSNISWANPNLEHADSVCPLKPFSQMVSSYSLSAYKLEFQKIIKEITKLLANQQNYSSASDLHTESTSPFFHIYAAIQKLNLLTLSNSRVQHLSEGLSRKLDHLNQRRKIYGKKISSFIIFEHRKTHKNLTKWGVWNKSYSTTDKINYRQYSIDILELYNTSISAPSIPFSDQPRHPFLGSVRTGQVLDGHGKDMIISICAHPLSGKATYDWWNWHSSNSYPPLPNLQSSELNDLGLFAIHVAEVTILHRVSCIGLHKMLPSPINSIWQMPYQTRRHYSVYEQNRSEWNLSVPRYELNSQKSFMSFLVSRHSIIEMAYPLVPSDLCSDDEDYNFSSKLNDVVALGATLGEPLLSYVHPEDTVRLLKALKIAWDEKLDVYYYYERLYNQRDSVEAIEKHINGRKKQDIEWRKDGIRVHNSVVELTVQWRMISYEKAVDGGVDEHLWRPFDWSDSELLDKHCRFVKIQLCRWPAILTPPKSQFHHFSRFFDDRYQDTSNKLGAHNEQSQQDDSGFILLSIKPITERGVVASPTSTSTEPHSKKNSESTPIIEISSPSKFLEISSFANSISRLERSLSSLSLAKNKFGLNSSFESLKVVSDELIEEEYTSDGSSATNLFSPQSPALSTSTSNSKRTSGYFPIDFLCEDSNFWKLPQRKNQMKNNVACNQLLGSIKSDIIQSDNLDYNNYSSSNIKNFIAVDSPNINEITNMSTYLGANSYKDNSPASLCGSIHSCNQPIPIQNNNIAISNICDEYCSSSSLASGSNSTCNTIKPSTIESSKTVNSETTSISVSKSPNFENYISSTESRKSTSQQLVSTAQTFNKNVYSRPPRGFFPRQKRIGPVRSAILVQAQLGAMKNQINPKI